ncbi:MAG: hypothetical protein PWQ41_1772 [Bacillota bacterium]|nr:hypothetical protein [Bacillota bacterium]MDK2925998.1 hypothetical protein [Bacillota bacterium]MDK2960848.1 hypothetical protein [Bacillota bacterium]
MTSSEGKEIENLLKEALHEEAARVAVPPADEAWARLTASLSPKPERQAWLARLRRVPPLAAVILVAAVLAAVALGYSANAGAFGRRVFSLVVGILQGGTPPQDVHISMANVTPPPSGAPTPPPDWPLATGERVVTLDEARKEAGFAFKEPSYLPRGLARDIVTLLPAQVNQYFRGEDSQLVLSQNYAPRDFAASSFFRNARVQKVSIGSAKGALVVQQNPLTKRDEVTLLWFADDIEFRLQGNISPGEALKVARSLR